MDFMHGLFYWNLDEYLLVGLFILVGLTPTFFMRRSWRFSLSIVFTLMVLLVVGVVYFKIRV